MPSLLQNKRLQLPIAVLLYFVACTFVMSTQRSVGMTLIFAGMCYAIQKLTKSDSLIQMLLWFKKYPWRGTLPLAVAVFFFVQLAGRGNLLLALLEALVIFAWFWLFAALGTFFEERRIKRLVERELAARRDAKSDPKAE